jgi:cAMP-dependent protein kinase regulator
MRTSVSAEAYGNFNKKGEFKARVIHKSNEAKSRIMKRME